MFRLESILIIFFLSINVNFSNSLAISSDQNFGVRNCKLGDAQDEECCSIQTIHGNTDIRRFMEHPKIGKECLLTVSNHSPEGTQRSFVFGKNGTVSINTKLSNSKIYNQSLKFFPILKKYPVYNNEVPLTDSVEIVSTSNQKWEFNTQTSRLESIEGCSYYFNNQINRKDLGFTTLCKHKLVLETPVTEEGGYYDYPEKVISLKDFNGKECRLKNKDYFDYQGYGNSKMRDKKGRYNNQNFKFNNNIELLKMLEKKCPHMDLQSIRLAAEIEKEDIANQKSRKNSENSKILK